jgi:hypothetical protein
VLCDLGKVVLTELECVGLEVWVGVGVLEVLVYVGILSLSEFHGPGTEFDV